MTTVRKAVCLFPLLAAIAMAQAPSGQAAAPPVSYSSLSQLNLLLSQVEQTSQTVQGDLSRLRIERWKADSRTKRQTETNVESLQRNLQGALPEIIARLRNSPEDLTETFKIYRNLDALYDVFGAVVESAGAFGSSDEFQSLSNDLTLLERSRHEFADRMETLAGAKEVELTRLRTQLRTVQAVAPPPPPPKKIIVDDNEPPKKAPKKKTPPKQTTTQSGTTPAKAQPPQ
ncbi:MAG TPA: hypothetical protein VMT28_17580 [Terriglobales bacterium]|jgi:hypothetical protein|nr:hypothetical protein [Terriglobales bacterium]